MTQNQIQNFEVDLLSIQPALNLLALKIDLYFSRKNPLYFYRYFVNECYYRMLYE